jgi:ribosomal protein S18 acetylase RimI-like enzyme
MLFVSGPERRARAWQGALKFRAAAGTALAQAQRERVALIRRACQEVGAPGPEGVPRAVLAQALLESRETDAAQALAGAGFLRLGDLAYMRRPLSRTGPGRVLEQATHPVWPEGLRVCSVEQLLGEGHPRERVDAWLVQALERSYIDTQDCPELCGMRSTEQVLDSHRSVGVFDPSLWWIAIDGSEIARACLLLSVCPEHDSVELVYLGLAPEVRGKGLGSMLLSFGLRRLYDHALAPRPTPGRVHFGGSGGMTCAVDTRNAPATKLYKHAGFERFGLRVPFVRSLRPGWTHDRA